MSAIRPTILVRSLLVAVPALGLAAGGFAHLAGRPELGATLFAAATLPVIVALAIEIAVSLARAEVGLDIVALVAMGSALVLDEPLAGAVVALMYAGGQFLEARAAGRARREMTALLERAPKTAMRRRGDVLEEVPIDAVVEGDRLLVRRGEVVPADGSVASEAAVLDLSALTGEAIPVRRMCGEAVQSGAANAGEAFDLAVTRPAAESTYAGIVRMVEAAERAKAPMVRLADRFALLFLAVTVTIAGGAWLLTGDPVRWLAVLVVATPCPLILAVPIAIIAGVSRAASRGVLIKGGGALEVLAGVRALILDKTGTVTEGHAAVAAVVPARDVPPDEILRLAASLDQASDHVVARALVVAATARGLPLAPPEDVHETPGAGIHGRIEGRAVAIGSTAFVADHAGGGMPAGPPAGHGSD
ncbi:MAG TPA: HAD-IC family P-type ATPase, partial [Bauldia sp.]|nr:HAD-IC family P-type ATPase [Bauldia sp.]